MNEKTSGDFVSGKENRYVLHQELISSNYSTITLAEDTMAPADSDERIVIVKRLHWDRFPGEKYKLFDEIRFQRLLKGHPHVSQIKDSWEDQKDIILVLEFAHKGDLHKFMWQYRSEMTQDRIKKILHQLLLALKDLHDRGIMHRDIKPENVLLDKNFDAKLIDFGWAGEIGNTMTDSEPAGTLTYMPPECLIRAPQNSAADIWSFGVLAYELYHYKEAFPAKDMQQALMAVNKTPPAFDPAVCPEEAENLIKACLKYRAHQRPRVKDLLLHPLFAELQSPPKTLPTPAAVVDVEPLPSGEAKLRDPTASAKIVDLISDEPVSNDHPQVILNLQPPTDEIQVTKTSTIMPKQHVEETQPNTRLARYSPLTGSRSTSREISRSAKDIKTEGNEYGLQETLKVGTQAPPPRVNDVNLTASTRVQTFQRYFTEKNQPASNTLRMDTGSSEYPPKRTKPKLELRKRPPNGLEHSSSTNVLNWSQPSTGAVFNPTLNASSPAPETIPREPTILERRFISPINLPVVAHQRHLYPEPQRARIDFTQGLSQQLAGQFAQPNHLSAQRASFTNSMGGLHSHQQNGGTYRSIVDYRDTRNSQQPNPFERFQTQTDTSRQPITLGQHSHSTRINRDIILPKPTVQMGPNVQPSFVMTQTPDYQRRPQQVVYQQYPTQYLPMGNPYFRSQHHFVS